MHGHSSGGKPSQIPQHDGVEVNSWELCKYINVFASMIDLNFLRVNKVVESQAKRYKYAGNNNVPKPEDALFPGFEGLGEDDLGGGFERERDSDHNVCAKHPKDVINKQTPQHNESIYKLPQGDKLDGLDGESDAEQIVNGEIFCLKEQAGETQSHKMSDNIGFAKVETELVRLTFRKTDFLEYFGDIKVNQVGLGEPSGWNDWLEKWFNCVRHCGHSRKHYVGRKKGVQVLFPDVLVANIKGEEHGRSKDGEHQGVVLGDCVTLVCAFSSDRIELVDFQRLVRSNKQNGRGEDSHLGVGWNYHESCRNEQPNY